MGCVYKRGNIYWIKYYRHGKPYQESSKSKKESDALRLLRNREGEIAEGKLPGIYFDRVKFDDLAEDMLADYRIQGRKSLDRAKLSVSHLTRFFGGYTVPEITTPAINQYIEGRLGDGMSAGTINRELSALRRMLNLGARQTPPKVNRVPYIPMMRERNVRQGFFEHSEYLALREVLPEYLKSFVSFAYKSGWRKKEIINLTWSHVDRQEGIVRLEAGETKNDEGRTIYLDEELMVLFNQLWEKRKRVRKIIPYVFPNSKGTGKIGDFRSPWVTACKKAGTGYKLFHDFRRTAVRNMVRSGVPERVAMTISGHKTRSVFERYNIVSADDLKMAASRQEAYLKSQMVTIQLQSANFQSKTHTR